METQKSERIDTPRTEVQRTADQRAAELKATFDSFQAAKEARALRDSDTSRRSDFGRIRRGSRSI